MPVRYGFGREISADDCIGTAAIVDDYLLAKALGQARGDDAADHIDRAPGWERHNQAHGSIRRPLRARIRDGRDKRKDRRQRDQAPAVDVENMRARSGHGFERL